MSTLRLAALVLAAGACQPMEGPPDPPASRTQAVAIDFQARAGARALACAERYSGVGLGKEAVRLGDLRFYVHDLRLVSATGAELPVALTPDGSWQSATVALLDFTGLGGACTGTAETNTALRGTYQDGGEAISGLRFTVGVPLSENHQDVAMAKAPLNDSAMFWSWNSGYKFLVAEGRSEGGKEFTFHLGSTGCMKGAGDMVTACSAPNRIAVDLAGFSLQGRRVVFDLAEVLAGLDLDQGAACHSGPTQRDCAPLFGRLGLPLGGMAPQRSKVFRIE